MSAQKKLHFPKLVMLAVLAAFVVSVAASYGHTHDDGHEKHDCAYDLFLQQYTAIESAKIKLILPADLFSPLLSRHGENTVFSFLRYNTAYPNAPPA